MNKKVIDFRQLPQIPSQQVYNTKPVSDFGMSMLLRMGFDETKGIGRRKQNQLPDVLVLKPRPKGLGLGAQLQKQQQQLSLNNGDYVKILVQPHKNLKGIIISSKQDLISVQLALSQMVVAIKKKNLQKISKKQYEKDQQEQQQKQVKLKKIKWIVPQIKLKIIDKNSKFYLKKVIVTDIISEKQFEVLEPQSKIHLNHLREKDLQTVIPKPGGIVLLLKGKHRGHKAKILQRNKNKAQVIVQTLNDLETINVKEDDLSQFAE